MKEWIDYLGGPAMAGVYALGAMLSVGTIVILCVAQFARGNSFDASQMFQDETDRTSGSKFVGLIGGMASIWVIIFLTVSNRLDASIFVWWLAVIVAGKVGTELVNKLQTTAPPNVTTVKVESTKTETNK